MPILSFPARATARFTSTAIAAATTLMLASSAQAGVPFPTRQTPAAVDLGSLAGQQSVTVSVLLKLRNVAQLEALAAAQQTPGQAMFHKFLTPAQFQQRFGAAPEKIAKVVAYLNKRGLHTTVAGNLIKASGSAAAVQSAFSVKLHDFAVASHGTAAGYRFHAPSGEPHFADADVATSVEGVLGLDNRPMFRPLSHQSPATLHTPTQRASAGVNTPDQPGHWTVTDLAQYYNVTPLYGQGIDGTGRTIGIVTLASFTPSDAFGYWNGLGLTVDPNRLTVVDVDGGPGAPDDNAGSGETTLDVEQSGGLAPGAKMIVYQAPNTDQGFLDAFVQAVNDNQVDSFSVSWGAWEWFDTQSDVTNAHGRSVTALKAFNNVFLQAAVQGMSGFAAAGDSGAYEPNNPGIAPVPYYSQTLGVDAPASSAWITAAGGTTLPGTQTYGTPNGPFPIAITQEQAWGWSYLSGLCAALGYDPVSCGIFPGGGGGGVSSYVPLPAYQAHVPGMQLTQPNQSWTDNTVNPPQTYVTLPAGYAGRNLPDVSLNADPQTGYTVLYTSSASGLETLSYYGGTSFVAPQLNGIAALVGQSAGGRTGLWNFQLYRMARSPLGYRGKSAPLHDITAGDNWFYSGTAGYEPAAGVGTLNVANFVKAMSR